MDSIRNNNSNALGSRAWIMDFDPRKEGFVQ